MANYNPETDIYSGLFIPDGLKLAPRFMVRNNILGPFDEEKERVVVGACLRNLTLMDHLPEFRPQHFFLARHRLVWRALNLLREQNKTRKREDKIFKPEDATIESLLGDDFEKLDTGPGPHYLLQQMRFEADGIYTRQTLRQWADPLVELAIKRTIVAATEFIASCVAEGHPSEEISHDMLIWTGMVEQLRADQVDVDPTLMDFMVETGDELKEAVRLGVALGLPTFLDRFDEEIGGMKKGEFWVLACLPGMGKSALMLQIAINAAKAGETILYINMEQGGVEIAKRVLAQEAGMSTKFINSVDEQTLAEVLAAINEQTDAGWPGRIYIASGFVQSGGYMTIAQIRTKVLAYISNGIPITRIFVDYLQLLSGDDAKGNQNRVIEVTQIAYGLKHIAAIRPVLAAAQLARSVGDKEPQLHHLRESGGIEQAADVVAFLHRPGYHTEDPNDIKFTDNFTSLYTAKHRNGPKAKITLYWLRQEVKFITLAEAANHSHGVNPDAERLRQIEEQMALDVI